MFSLFIKACTARFGETFLLRDISWQLQPGECWALIGPNGSGKSALGALLDGEGVIEAGRIDGMPQRVARVSLEQQAALIERERKRDGGDRQGDLMAGTPVVELLAETCRDEKGAPALYRQLGLDGLMERGFRQLSTGETRRLMLARALNSEPQILVLDEPFDGLDAKAAAGLAIILAQLLQSRGDEIIMVLVLNRWDEVPAFVSHYALLQQGRLQQQTAATDSDAVMALSQLLHLQTTDLQIPLRGLHALSSPPPLDPAEPLIVMQNVGIAYGDTQIFKALNWRVAPGQHWQVTGPNGSGKTGLLNLVTGDHPQCYTNDIRVFGFKRGSGESIWEIKQYIGYVSSQLQWDYRVSIGARNVIVSGFFDSIGLYEKPTDTQRLVADEWLTLLSMQDQADTPLQQLSHGDQRLLLIARAMVKQPTLLILDEPCLGLDDRNRELVLALIAKICAETATTVVYVNHHRQDRIDGIEHFLSLDPVTGVTLSGPEAA